MPANAFGLRSYLTISCTPSFHFGSLLPTHAFKKGRKKEREKRRTKTSQRNKTFFDSSKTVPRNCTNESACEIANFLSIYKTFLKLEIFITRIYHEYKNGYYFVNCFRVTIKHEYKFNQRYDRSNQSNQSSYI